MDLNVEMLDVIEDSFATYAAMTIQDRAIIDARDGLKPSQRQCMYSMLLRKYTYKKPFVKSQECVGGAMADFYVHGDQACYDLMARLARPYNLRYPLMGFKGQYGHITNGRPSAARYTDMRLGELGCQMFEEIDND
jgi:topoisomerase-4 subunit A